MFVKNNVNAHLNTTNATIGKSAALNSLAPIGVADTVPLTDDDAQNLIGDGLDINGDGTPEIAGYGYKRIETWSNDGVQDIDLGFRYQYLKTEDWRLAFTGGIRVPTGETNDPDNMVDWGLGTGAYALLFRFNNDYTGIKNFIVNATLSYDLVLPDHETMRVYSDANQPITANKEEVDRDIGDLFEADISGTYSFLEGFSVTLLYHYAQKLKNRISGNQGYYYDALEDETNYTEHEGGISLSYSTLPLYMAKKFPVPFTANLSYRNRFAGSNNRFVMDYISVGFSLYF
jgi:hypothetical protein